MNWNNEQESQEAFELMRKWEAMNPEDSLELLSKDFQEPAVRQYAVSRLMQADDEVLLLYLLQLVQALRYENIDTVKTAEIEVPDQAMTTGITQGVLSEALEEEENTTPSLNEETTAAAQAALPEVDDPADIQDEILNSSGSEIPLPAEVRVLSPVLLSF